MDAPSEKLTKLDAARRQLRDAIILFFERRDPISVHTLAAAALQVFADVGKVVGAQSLLRHGLYIREEKKKEWFAILNEAQNFFKHADKDPDGAIEFKPAVTPFYLLDAVLLQVQLDQKLIPASRCFLLWFYLAYPDVLTDEPYKTFATATVQSGVSPKDFQLFLDLIKLNECGG